jgi:hypothetical protein
VKKEASSCKVRFNVVVIMTDTRCVPSQAHTTAGVQVEALSCKCWHGLRTRHALFACRYNCCLEQTTGAAHL